MLKLNNFEELLIGLIIILHSQKLNNVYDYGSKHEFYTKPKIGIC